LEEGPDDLDPKDFTLSTPYVNQDRLKELRAYMQSARRARVVAKAAYPNNKRVVPCARCGRPHKMRDGWGAQEQSTCPVCSKNDMREVAGIMGWNWPRMKNPFSRKKDVDSDTSSKAFMGIGFGDASFPIGGGGQG